MKSICLTLSYSKLYRSILIIQIQQKDKYTVHPRIQTLHTLHNDKTTAHSTKGCWYCKLVCRVQKGLQHNTDTSHSTKLKDTDTYNAIFTLNTIWKDSDTSVLIKTIQILQREGFRYFKLYRRILTPQNWKKDTNTAHSRIKLVHGSKLYIIILIVKK